MKILMTRHPQTEYNVKDIAQGSYTDFDDGRISKKGIEQMENLISKSKGLGIDLIISSDLPRCRLLAEKIGSESGIEVEYSPKLREKDYGVFTGKINSDINWESLDGGFEERKPLKGESLNNLKSRADDFMNGVIERYGKTEKVILLVSHSIFIKVLLGSLIGLGLYESVCNIVVDNCSLIELEHKIRDKKDSFRIIIH